MIGCVRSAIHRQMCSLYVSPSSHPHHLKTSERRLVFKCFLNHVLIEENIIFAVKCRDCMYGIGLTDMQGKHYFHYRLIGRLFSQLIN